MELSTGGAQRLLVVFGGLVGGLRCAQLCEVGVKPTCIVWRIANEQTSRACNGAPTLGFTSGAACSLSSSIVASNTRPRCNRERTVPIGQSRTVAVSA